MRTPSLRTQVLAVNTLLITATVFAASVAARLNLAAAGERRQFLVLVAALLVTVLGNGVVLRRRFAPLERLVETVGRAETLALPAADPEVWEVARLHEAFARAHGAVLRAQEAERARIARDLHDEANQALTAVLLRLQASAQDAPPRLREELQETQRVATQAMEELLRLARELRPAALDDLGLLPALRTQVDEFARRARVDAALQVAPGLPELDPDGQLVAYRVVQESLSNVARHAGAGRVRVELGPSPAGGAMVRVSDDGCGFAEGREGGLGLDGMRERARIAGGSLAVRSVVGSGTTIELRLPEAA
jgi:two-component system, NarL family, sensor histidine kinase UhpB